MSIDTAFIAALAKRIADERQRACDHVCSFRLDDFSQYRYSAGYVQALDDTTVIMGEILEEMQKA